MAAWDYPCAMGVLEEFPLGLRSPTTGVGRIPAVPWAARQLLRRSVKLTAVLCEDRPLAEDLNLTCLSHAMGLVGLNKSFVAGYARQRTEDRQPDQPHESSCMH